MLKVICLFIGIAIAYLVYNINYSLDITKNCPYTVTLPVLKFPCLFPQKI